MAVVTAARRGELVAIRWTDIRWREADLLIAHGYVSHRGQRVIKDTKTHQKRRQSLDLATIDVLRAHFRRREEICAKAGVPFRADGYLFTRDGFGEEPWLPDSMTQRFLCLRDDQALATPASMAVRL
jgi:integrase